MQFNLLSKKTPCSDVVLQTSDTRLLLHHTGEGDDQQDGEGLLSQFIEYIKARKTVPLEQLATEFKLRTTDVIDRVHGLEAMGHLTGVMDERGKVSWRPSGWGKGRAGGQVSEGVHNSQVGGGAGWPDESGRCVRMPPACLTCFNISHSSSTHLLAC